MKKLTLLLSVLFASCLLQAQTNVIVTGRVIDSNQNPLSGYPVWYGLSYHGTNNSTVYTDSLGFYRVNVNSNTTQGTFLVIVQDCDYDSIGITIGCTPMTRFFTQQDFMICPLNSPGGGNPNPCTNMSGLVMTGLNAAESAMVWLYEHDTTGGFLVDSTQTDTLGNFGFTAANLDSTKVYSIYASLLANDPSHGFYINTYSTKAATFAAADSLTCLSLQNLVQMNPFGWGLGANYIGGATYRVTRGEEPEANVRVILYDAQKNAIGETWSDANGDYEFANIEAGMTRLNDYKINDETDFMALAEDLRAKNTSLIQSCTMKGASHDELHKWLHPHLGLVQALSESADAAEAQNLIVQLDASYETYLTYFE